MSTQRYVYFYPIAEKIVIYREDADGFRYGVTVGIADLSEPQQAVVEAAMLWQASQFDSDEQLVQVIFEPYIVPPESPEDEPSIGLKGIASSSKPGPVPRGRTLENDSKDLPSDLRAGLIGLWQSLATIPDPE